MRIGTQRLCRKARALVPTLLPYVLGLLMPLAACLFVLNSRLAAQSSGLTEYEIKAGFLFNFTKFVEWPSDAFTSANAPIVIAITGENPFGDFLTATIAGKVVNGRAVVFKQFKKGDNLRDCTVLFISTSEKKRTAQILESLKGSSVLTVGESTDFSKSGGMISLLV